MDVLHYPASDLGHPLIDDPVSDLGYWLIMKYGKANRLLGTLAGHMAWAWFVDGHTVADDGLPAGLARPWLLLQSADFRLLPPQPR